MAPTPCRPRRSWHGRRLLAVRFAAIGSLLALAVAVLSPWRQEVFAPGPLSGPHAQILGNPAAHSQHAGDPAGPHSQANHARCAACHSVARGGLAAWFFTGGAGHAGVSQTQLCIECHHASIHPERAMAAHNLTADEFQRVADAATSAAQPFSVSITSIGRGERTWHDSMPRPSFAQDQVECAACHREHGGKDADITWMSPSQCQTCHQDRFASLAQGHPDWQAWPYGRGGQIAFDHATHQGDHFAKEGKAFDCQSCHTVTTAGEIARTGAFETTCAACHDRSLRSQAGQGIDLVALPTLDIDTVREAGIPVPPWPSAASGLEPVTIAPLTRMLLASDPKVAAAMEQLTDPAANLWQGPPSPTRLRATATVAHAVHTLMDSMADDLGSTVEGRLHASGSLALLGQLSPQLVATARDHWFASPPAEAPAGPAEVPAGNAQAQRAGRNSAAEQGRDASSGTSDSLLPAERSLLAPQRDDLLLAPHSLQLGELSLNDPLLADPLHSDPLLSSLDPLAGDLAGAKAKPGRDVTDVRPERFDPERMLPAGGWYRDDVRLAIRYRAASYQGVSSRGAHSRGADHADPVLRAVVELADDATLAAADREALLELPAVAACVECHPAVRRGEETSWRSLRSDAGRRTFTRFTHRPHMHLPALSDCTHCHAISRTGGGAMPRDRELTTAALTNERPEVMPKDFAPLSRATCVQCHTPQAAGDNCTQCHLYHVDPPGSLFSTEENRGASSAFIPR